MISKQKSQLLGKQLEAMPSESAGEGAAGLEPGVSLGLGGFVFASLQGPACSLARGAELRAPEMTVLAKGQVAAQIHSPAMRQLR